MNRPQSSTKSISQFSSLKFWCNTFNFLSFNKSKYLVLYIFLAIDILSKLFYKSISIIILKSMTDVHQLNDYGGIINSVWQNNFESQVFIWYRSPTFLCCKHVELDKQWLNEDDKGIFPFFLFQNAKLTVIPVSTKISAQSVKMDFTYTSGSALTIAQKGWKPTTIPWSASALVRRSSNV